nr:hypothetical protein [Nannocystis sp.]
MLVGQGQGELFGGVDRDADVEGDAVREGLLEGDRAREGAELADIGGGVGAEVVGLAELVEAVAELLDRAEVLQLGQFGEAEHVADAGADRDDVVQAHGGAGGDVGGDDEGLLQLQRLGSVLVRQGGAP